KGKNEEDSCYQKALLDRQFLNYPFLLSTHVFLFETMFSNRRESVFGFSQLINSVIVLDEIQSYKNKIWSEIIIFLERSEEHTSELQSRFDIVCRLLLEKKKIYLIR